MTARPSKKIAATGRESSEPLLRLHGECTHNLARTMPTIGYVSREDPHGVPTDAAN
jgi:hypothetical protein